MQASNEESAQVKARPLRLLIIEDDPDDFYLVNLMLQSDQRKSYEITHRNDLDSGLHAVQHESYDVVLLDLGLGETQGLDTLASVLNFANSIPTIVLTGSNDAELGEQAIKQGAEDYIPKGEASTSLLSRSISYAIERHNLILQLQQQATTDMLTGLPNRAAIFEKLENSVDHSNRKTISLAVAMLDLDGFKEVNDTLGHHAGDDLLRQIADRLRNELRRTDFAGRLGGDEFILVLHHYNNQEELVSVLEKKRKMLSDPIKLYVGDEVHVMQVGVSIGTAEWFPGCTAQLLISEADRAMYRSKSKGKNQITLSETLE